jgi:hypothetical protein
LAFDTIDDLEGTIIHQTSAIRDFLALSNIQKTVVAAPKGCGKTLLIKLKRRSLQNRGYTLLPKNQLVARPPGYAPPFAQDLNRHIRESPQYWSTLWQVAITSAVLKLSDMANMAHLQSALKSVFENEHLADPFQIFMQLLHFRPKDFFDMSRDYQSYLLPVFMKHHTQTAVFIDNVDEFFGHHLKDTSRSGLHGEIAKEFWFDAQIGLLMAVRQIAGHNPHVKIFAAIRTEAFSEKQLSIPDLANVRSHLVTVKFDAEDLRQIFVENIGAESADRLYDAAAADPFERLVGPKSVRLRHPYTGRNEDVFGYVARHTLGRPRDFMTIGKHISELRKTQRDPEQVKAAVNAAATEIATSYITEVSPHLNWFDQDVLFGLIDGNTFDTARVKAMARGYDTAIKRKESAWVNKGDGQNAFATLYAAGLLGIARDHTFRPGPVQHFESVFDLNGHTVRDLRSVPDAKSYLVHNVLGSYLRHRNTTNSWRPNTINIISPGENWTENDDFKFVAQIDVFESEAIRNDPIKSSFFRELFDGALLRAADCIDYKELVGGDGAALADSNGYILVRAVQRMAEELQGSLLNASVRVGLDFGPVRITQSADKGARRLDQGPSIIRSARLQNSSKPDYLLTVPEVVKKLQTYEINWPFFRLEPAAVGFGAAWNGTEWTINAKTPENGGSKAPELIALPLLQFKIE